jgi:hypothetical protein
MVARRPAAAFGGHSLLEALVEDPAAALDAVEGAFDWAGTA